jgi:hypothetical protein
MCLVYVIVGVLRQGNIFFWSVENIGQKDMHYLLGLLGLGVQAFSFFSLFGHSENHKLITRAVLQILHSSGVYVAI